jgi:hypothetical protein
MLGFAGSPEGVGCAQCLTFVGEGGQTAFHCTKNRGLEKRIAISVRRLIWGRGLQSRIVWAIRSVASVSGALGGMMPQTGRDDESLGRPLWNPDARHRCLIISTWCRVSKKMFPESLFLKKVFTVTPINFYEMQACNGSETAIFPCRRAFILLCKLSKLLSNFLLAFRSRSGIIEITFDRKLVRGNRRLDSNPLYISLYRSKL